MCVVWFKVIPIHILWNKPVSGFMHIYHKSEVSKKCYVVFKKGLPDQKEKIWYIGHVALECTVL